MGSSGSVIVDTSALLAVLFGEPQSPRIVAALHQAPGSAAGSPTVFETELVASARRGSRGAEALHRLLKEFGVEEVPFGPAQRRAAAEAFLTYGKGRHSARLNLGDCMTYGTAKIADEPLLCIGSDFARTDLELVQLD